MKILVMFALISLASGNLRDELGRGNLIDVSIACQKKAGVTIGFSELLDLKSEVQDVKCMRLCMLKKLGLMNNDGKVIADAAKKPLVSLLSNNINEENAASVINSCNGLKVSGDRCEAASVTINCLKIELEGISRSFDFML